MSTLSTPPQHPTREEPDRNLALELVRVTEAAAIAAGSPKREPNVAVLRPNTAAAECDRARRVVITNAATA